MAWIIKDQLLFAILLFLILADFIPTLSSLDCGYPGSPAFGRPLPVRNSYRPGSAVGFSCALGYTLLGNLKRVCLQNGTWSGKTPICDRSLPGMEQHASSRATLERYDAQKAIDGHRDTCTYTDKKKPRWIRVDLRKPHLVQAVAVTVPRSSYHSDNAHFTIYVISVKDETTASYHKCADFNGKFPTPTVKLPCSVTGIQGSYVHIEDNRKNVDYFSICEIEIFVQKDVYECGEADRPANSYTTNPEIGIVEYRCMHGYQLLGSMRRHCLPNGQWSGTQPLCREIVCPLLDEIPHGTLHYIGPARGRPQQGTVANVTCDYGFYSNGNTLQCLESGEWSSGTLTCDPIDCKAPTIQNHQYLLLNGTTTYGSMALFYCQSSQDQIQESTTVLTCREDGKWMPTPTLNCIENNGVSTLGLVEEEENVVPSGVIIGMAVVVFLLLLILIFILLFRRKQLMRRASTESLPSKETTSSNESKTGLPYENDVFYASVAFEEEKQAPPATKSSSVEKGILSTILCAKRKLQGQEKVKDRNDSTSTSTACFYEEIGLRSSSQSSHPKEIDSMSQPVYAQVDLEEKRRSRLAKSLTDQLDCSGHTVRNGQFIKEDTPDYESELDSEPIKLRELPPIPDDDQSSGTYASLSKPPEPPPTPSFMRDNDIYNTGELSCQHVDGHVSVMKDNDLYSSSS